MVLRKTFGPNRNDVREGWREFQNLRGSITLLRRSNQGGEDGLGTQNACSKSKTKKMVRMYEGRKLLGRRSHKYERNIKMDIKKNLGGSRLDNFASG
jgi:hypothetical protein